MWQFSKIIESFHQKIYIYFWYDCILMPLNNTFLECIMLKCKKCSSEKVTKNGFVRKNQRWNCKEYGYNFIVGDKRTNHKVAVKKALCVLLYSTMKGTFNHLAKY